MLFIYVCVLSLLSKTTHTTLFPVFGLFEFSRICDTLRIFVKLKKMSNGNIRVGVCLCVKYLNMSLKVI